MQLPDPARSRAVLMGHYSGRVADALADPVTGGFDNARCVVSRELLPEDVISAEAMAAEDTFLVFIGDIAVPHDLLVLLSLTPARYKVVIGEKGWFSLTGFDLLIASAPDLINVLRAGLPDEGDLISLSALAQAVGQPGTQVHSDLAIARNPAVPQPARPALPDDARLLLGRAALLRAGEPLDEDTAQVLGGTPDERSALVDGGWITPDGHLLARTEAEARLAADEDADRYRAALRDHRVLKAGVLPQPHLVRDYWTTDDTLGYLPYAKALAAFIRHPDTRPPLTIGVKGRWGAGKTSLMRMVRAELDPPDVDGEPRRVELTSGSRKKLSRRRRADADTPVSNGEVLRSAAADQAGAQGLGVEADRDWRATVWFNPWKYSNSEQVWAGLAHEVITQITGRLRTGDRERFWLRMNLARVDRLALRRRVYRLLLERLAPWVVAFLGAAVVLGVLWLTGLLAGPARWLLAGGSGTAVVAAAAFSVWFQRQRASIGFGQLLSGPASGALAAEAKGLLDLVTDPGYTAKAGFLHAVHSDMERVLRLVATEDRPLVVFVDDLDRCSPGVVAQVIEAINLFLAGEFDNCVFVVAMEPDIVAAHVETAYADLAARVGGEGGELGWRFLEKIVQLPMGLPPVDTHVPRYLRGLFGVPDDHVPEPGPTPVAIPPATGDPIIGTFMTGPLPHPRVIVTAELVAWAESRLRGATLATLDRMAAAARDELSSKLVRGLDPITHQLLAGSTAMGDEAASAAIAAEAVREAVDRVHADVFARSYTDEQALTAISAALPALGSPNPREIKRYVNLFRFYSFIVAARRSAVSAEQIAKVAGLAIRWPDLLTALARDLPDLERAASGDDETWAGAVADLRATGPRVTALRAFLAQGPDIADAARLLL